MKPTRLSRALAIAASAMAATAAVAAMAAEQDHFGMETAVDGDGFFDPALKTVEVKAAR